MYSMCWRRGDTVRNILRSLWGPRANITIGEKRRQKRLKEQQPQRKGGDCTGTISNEEMTEQEPLIYDEQFTETVPGSALDRMDDFWAGDVNGQSIAPLLIGAVSNTDFTQGDKSWSTYPIPFDGSGSLPPMELFASSSNSASPSSFGTSPASSHTDGSPVDSYLLPVHELTLLKGMMRIAERLGSTGDLWSLTAQSPFTRGGGTPAHLLPAHLKPTATQILLPHHPFLDFLPWPSVRDKVIGIFSLPEQSRPPSASGPMGLACLAYDIEDSSEGVRIYGDDPYDPQYWEVGQVFFQRWWFLFDRDIIATSNRWRKLRGAPPLAITAGAEASSQ